MGLNNTKVAYDDIEFIRAEVDTLTPVVGIELTPKIHIHAIGACIFEWHRLPISTIPPPSTPTEKRDTIKPQSPLENDEEEDIDSEDTQSDHKVEEQALSPSTLGGLSDLKPIKLNYNVNDNPLTRTAQTPSLVSPMSATSTTVVETSRLKEFIPTLVAQSASYTPIAEDIGHRLRLTIVFVGTTQEGTHTHELLTEATIALPTTLPKRKWIKNKIYRDAKRHHITPVDHLGILSQVQRKNCKTKIVSYDLYGDHVLAILKDKTKRETILPNCPDYALSEAYRKRMLLLEITSYSGDIICLQNIHAKEYNRWYNEISMKSGLSGMIMVNEPSANQNRPPNDDDIPIDYSEHARFGNALLYRRSKFLLSKEWCVRVTKEDIPQQLTQEQQQQCELFASTNPMVAVIAEFEFRDMVEMMTYLKKHSSSEKHEPVSSFDKIRLLVVNVACVPFNPQETIIPFLQVKAIVGQLETIMRDRDYTHVKPCVVMTGNFRADSGSLVYKYLSNTRTPDQQREQLATMLQMNKENLLEPKQGELISLTEQETQLLANCRHDFNFQSSYGVVVGQEYKTTLSDQDMTVRNTTNFTWYTPNCVQARRVARESNSLMYPNSMHVSEHPAQLTEFELTLLAEQFSDK